MKPKKSKRATSRPPQKTKSRQSVRFVPQGFQGKLTVTPSGFGFVALEDKSKDIFIPAQYMEGAIDGDIVEAVLIPDAMLTREQRAKGRTGRILRVIERGRDTLVGELLSGKRILPFSKRIPQAIQVVGSVQDAKIGDWVMVRIRSSENHPDGRVAEFVSRIGSSGSISSDLDAVVAAFDIPPPYTAEEEEQASKLKPTSVNRKDCSDLFCLTIDPFDAKDHDDAMSLEQGTKRGTWILGVHIADVASYVQANSYFDKAARERCFTSYLPGRTLPMLPRELTKKMSLTPGEKGAAHSIFFTIEKKTGKVLSAERMHTWIKITHSLNYNDVQHFIDGERCPKWDKTTQKHLKTMIELGRLLRENRAQNEHFLALEIPEIRVIVDEFRGEVVGMVHKEQKEAEHLVEECMLLANSAVAEEMLSKGVPGLYRIHAEPDPEKMEQFAQFVYESYGIDVGDLTTRKACNQFINSLPRDDQYPTIMNAFLRAMARAVYSAECVPHYGLGKAHYLHFTSPIRRYTDLIVHRQLTALSQRKPLASNVMMESVAEWCTSREMNVDEAYYAANDRMKLHYIWKVSQKDPMKTWRGVVNRITSRVIVVEIHELALFGVIDVDRMESLIHRKMRGQKKGRKSQSFVRALNLGDAVELYIEHIDFTRGNAYFQRVDLEG